MSTWEHAIVGVMSVQRRKETACGLLLVFATVAVGSGCSSSDANEPSPTSMDSGSAPDAGFGVDASEAVADSGVQADAGPIDDPDRATLTHSFGTIGLRPNEELTPCISWTLDNDQSIYVETVTLSNGGWFHHSNWFVVPESLYPGEDGLWNCSERGFSEVFAALAGTVLFAQSTQAQVESQSLGERVVIKVPPRHKVVGSLHLLNQTPRVQSSQLVLSLDILHPKRVDTVVAPFRLLYGDLRIAPRAESRFSAECDFAATSTTGTFDVTLHYLLPHYHELGNYFRIEVAADDERDGQVLLELDGFNTQPNGKVFSPPLVLNDIRGFRFTCGFNNPRTEEVRWGIGDQEMCEALALGDVTWLYDARNEGGNQQVGEVNGILMNEGPCTVNRLPKNMNQAPPTDSERSGDFYIPATDPADVDVPPVLACRPPASIPDGGDQARLSIIQSEILRPSCAFSSCHDSENPAAGLDFASPGLHARLMNHTVVGNADAPLIAPNNPAGSWLYQRISQCEPTDRSGQVVPRMPLGSATLIDDTAIGLINTWISNGAEDN